MVKLIEDRRDESEIEFGIPLMSLPLMLKTNINYIPPQNSYFYADPEKVKSISRKLSGGNLKIGKCWQVAIPIFDIGRSLPHPLFSNISALPDIKLSNSH